MVNLDWTLLQNWRCESLQRLGDFITLLFWSSLERWFFHPLKVSRYASTVAATSSRSCWTGLVWPTEVWSSQAQLYQHPRKNPRTEDHDVDFVRTPQLPKNQVGVFRWIQKTRVIFIEILRYYNNILTGRIYTNNIRKHPQRCTKI